VDERRNHATDRLDQPRLGLCGALLAQVRDSIIVSLKCPHNLQATFCALQNAKSSRQQAGFVIPAYAKPL
jgi:hypothetical protein